MVRRSLVRRYMQAGFHAAEQAGVVQELGAQLARLQEAARHAPDLARLLQHPGMALERKLQAVADVLGAEPLPILCELLRTIIEHNRTEILRAAGEVYREVWDEARGIVRARVTRRCLWTGSGRAGCVTPWGSGWTARWCWRSTQTPASSAASSSWSATECWTAACGAGWTG